MGRLYGAGFLQIFAELDRQSSHLLPRASRYIVLVPYPIVATVDELPIMSDDNGPKTIIALWVMTTVSFLFMNLRFFCKGVYTKKLRLDDGVLLVAWVCTAYTDKECQWSSC